MKVAKLRWWIIGLVCAGTIVNYLSRNSLSVVAPALMVQLHFDEKHYSWIISAFQICYTIAQPITGYIMDVIGLKLGFFIFALAWSLVNIAHVLAGGWLSLAFLRGLMGLSEASAIPAGMKASAEWFPVNERGIAGGLFNIGTSVGAMLTIPLVAWTARTFSDSGTGNEMAFTITGILGLLFAFTWFFLYRSPQQHPWLTQKERLYIEKGQESWQKTDTQSAAKPALKQILTQRNFWGMAIARFLADPAWATLSFWMPLYLTKVMHLSLSKIALFGWLPFLAADFGCVAGGLIAKILMDVFKIDTINARRGAFSVGALLMLSLGFICITTNPYIAIALLSLGGFAHQTLSTVVITMSADLFKKDDVATVAGFAGASAWAGQLIFNLFLGLLVAKIGYAPFFIALSLFDIVGAIVLWIVIKAPPHNTSQMADAM